LEVIDQLPPIVVDEKTMVVIDGIHRLEAYRRAKRTMVPAILFSGDETEAVACAIRANVGHGKPLTLSEKETAASTLLTRCPERSDRWIAQVCALSHSTVGGLRKAVAADAAEVRIGQDGRRRAVTSAATPAGNSQREGDRAFEPHRRRTNTEAVLAGEAPSGLHPALPATEVRESQIHQLNDRNGTATLTERNTALPRADLGVFDWFERTSVSEADLGTFVDNVPLGERPEIIDECRRRARLWDTLAEGLERRRTESLTHQTCLS
jgi:ParB-like chromosome segregation protein Spo0J